MLAKPKLVVIFLSAAVVTYGFVGGLLEKVSAEEDDPYRQLSIFTDVLTKVKSDYVETPDMEAAFQGALQGMVEALDPFSSFVPAGVYGELEPKSGLGGQAGLVLSKRYGYLYVVSVDPDSAAEQQGLRTGDLVESIDGTVTMRMSAWEAEARLRGEPGSTVELRVVRARRTEPSTVTLQRGPLQLPDVSSRIVEQGIGLLRVPHLEAGASEQISEKLKLLEASRIEGLLIDLRGNARGTPEEAVRAADLMLPKGKQIVSARARGGAAVEHVSLAEPLLEGLPVVLMTDGGTSGAAEIFAAALQDHQRATVVGERSNGKGSLQTGFPVGDGARLFVSTTLFYRPGGEPLQADTTRKSGVTPDVRAPNQEFVTNFYFENTTENFDDSLVDDFYRKLDAAVEAEQLNQALEQVRERVARKAA